MKETKQQRETRLIELVETHNIYLAIHRIRTAQGYDYNGPRWKRALYHALGLAYVDRSIQEKIRIALELP